MQLRGSTFPDYKKLSQTPLSLSDQRLGEQIRRGSGEKHLRMVGFRPAIPMLQSKRLEFPAKQCDSHQFPIAENRERLAIPETPSQYPFANHRHVTSDYTVGRQFVNRSDQLLSARDRERLEVKSLLENGQFLPHQHADDFKQLLEMSATISSQLSSLLSEQDHDTSAPEVDVTPETSVTGEAGEEEEEKTQAEDTAPRPVSRRQAIKDVKALQDGYLGMAKDEQRQLLSKLRERYGAPRNSSVQNLKKMIGPFAAASL
jgi:hypothetical protein